jgi:hypothetical protein
VVISLYTYELPATKTRYAIGFVCTPEALMVYKEKCPHLGDDELRAAEYDSERLWTRYSITIVETCLWLLWVSAFVSIGTLAAAFAATEIDFRKFDAGLHASGSRDGRGKTEGKIPVFRLQSNFTPIVLFF